MALVVNLNEIEDLSVNIDKEGDFILKIVEVKEDGFDKNGNIKVRINYAGFNKLDAEKNMLNHSELYFIASYGKRKIADLFAGLKVDNSVDMELLAGRYVEVSVKGREYTKNNGDTAMGYNIDKYTYCSLNDKLPPLVAPAVDIDDSEIPF